MKTKIYLGVLLGMMLMASCSEDTSAIDDLNEELDKMSAMGVYDGEWRTGVNGRVICQGQLTVLKDTMEFVLPEMYIVSGFFRNWNDGIKDIYPDEP